MRKTPLVLLIILLLASCSGSRKRCSTPKELARELLTALQENSESKYLALYPTKKECMNMKGELLEDEDFKYTRSKYDSDDRGISEDEVKDYFEDSRRRARNDFKDLLDDAKDNDINWSKAKVKKVRTPRDSKMKRGEKPGWIEITFTASDKTFFVVLGNTFKNEDGWNIGLVAKMNDYILDHSGYDIDLGGKNPFNSRYDTDDADDDDDDN